MKRELLTPSEVAVIFRVTPETVNRWATDGLLPDVITPGGRRRYPYAAVAAAYAAGGGDPDSMDEILRHTR